MIKIFVMLQCFAVLLIFIWCFRNGNVLMWEPEYSNDTECVTVTFCCAIPSFWDGEVYLYVGHKDLGDWKEAVVRMNFYR